MKERFPNIPDKLADITEIAYNLWWSWHPAARMLFKMLDRAAWKEGGHNPAVLLLTRELILKNPDRLKKILNNRWQPLQIIFAGKAHPADDEGKRILQKIINFAHDPALGGRVAFVENYDEQLAQYMVSWS